LEGQRIMEDWIQKYGDKIDGVFSILSLLGEGSVVALEGANMAGDVKVVTSSISEDTLKMLKEGKISWVSSEPGTLTGRWGLQYAIKILNGEEIVYPEKSKGFFEVPKNIVILPSIQYDSSVDANEPYKYDWAPKGWSIP
jgi:ABC-type sugar transport system substrate-binding protein